MDGVSLHGRSAVPSEEERRGDDPGSASFDHDGKIYAREELRAESYPYLLGAPGARERGEPARPEREVRNLEGLPAREYDLPAIGDGVLGVEGREWDFVFSTETDQQQVGVGVDR